MNPIQPSVMIPNEYVSSLVTLTTTPRLRTFPGLYPKGNVMVYRDGMVSTRMPCH